MTSLATPEDHVLAAYLAYHAGELLNEIRGAHIDGEPDEARLRADGDRKSHELLMHALVPRIAAGDAVLSEEGERSAAHAGHERIWIVDPLDGTREFAETGRTDWAVHVALAIDGFAACGAVTLPALGVTFSTASPPGRPPASPPARPRIIVSRTRPPAIALELAESLGGDLVEMGSAGAKAMAIVRGDADIYLHAGGQYQWDSCAPVAVAAAAGLHCSRVDGTQLVYGGADPYLPDLLICRTELAPSVLAFVKEHSPRS